MSGWIQESQVGIVTAYYGHSLVAEFHPVCHIAGNGILAAEHGGNVHAVIDCGNAGGIVAVGKAESQMVVRWNVLAIGQFGVIVEVHVAENMVMIFGKPATVVLTSSRRHRDVKVNVLMLMLMLMLRLVLMLRSMLMGAAVAVALQGARAYPWG